MAMPGGWAWIRESRAHDSACQALGQGSAPKGTWAAAARGTRVHLLLPVLLHLKSRALPAPSFSAATNRVGFQNEHHSKVLLGGASLSWAPTSLCLSPPQQDPLAAHLPPTAEHAGCQLLRLTL